MQVVFAIAHGEVQKLVLPGAGDEALPGIAWGHFDELLTPAFWRSQAWQHQSLGNYEGLRLGRCLVEEVAACLLGGYGMPAEVGLRAYYELREAGLLSGTPSQHEIEVVLSKPLQVRGRSWRYRFPRQKARYLAACLRELDGFREPDDDVTLRNALSKLPGIGLKTASWIVRNCRSSDRVAVLDVHIMRACRHMGLFHRSQTPERHYLEMEASFLALAEALGTPAAVLDALMWDYMRRISALGIGAGGKEETLSVAA